MQATKYKFGAFDPESNQEVVIEVSEQELQSLPTLKTMVDGEAQPFNRNIVIPMQPIVTAPILRFILNYYYYTQKTTADLRRRDGGPFREVSHYIEAANIVVAANYLQAESLVRSGVNWLYTHFYRMPFAQLEKEARAYTSTETSKRKKLDSDDDGDDEEEREKSRFRIQYKRALYTHHILEWLLPSNLVRPVNHRIQKYVNPIATNGVVCTTIQHAEGTFVRRNKMKGSKFLSLTKRAQLKAFLTAHPNAEILVGETFVAVITPDAKIRVYAYGDFDDDDDNNDEAVKIFYPEEVKMRNSEVIAAWAYKERLFVLNEEGLFWRDFSRDGIFARRGDKMVTRGFNLFDVVQVYMCDDGLACVVCATERMYIGRVEEEEFRDKHVLSLEPDERLFGLEDRLFIYTGAKSNQLFRISQLDLLPYAIKGLTTGGIKFIDMRFERAVFVSDDDRLYIKGPPIGPMETDFSALASFPDFGFRPLKNFHYKGAIVSVALTQYKVQTEYDDHQSARRDAELYVALIVATTEAFYVFAEDKVIVNFFDSNHDDYPALADFQLRFTPILRKPRRSSSSSSSQNKKPRLSCMKCSEAAKFVDKATMTRGWCSYACMLSTNVK